MGYRSHVVSAIYGPTEDINKLIVLGKLAPLNVFDKFSCYIDLYAVNQFVVGYKDSEFRLIMFDAQDVKWYDTYSDVQAWHKLMDNAKEMNLNVEFARVGEDPDDIERIESGDSLEGLLSVETYSSIDYLHFSDGTKIDLDTLNLQQGETA